MKTRKALKARNYESFGSFKGKKLKGSNSFEGKKL
jgi:hypothetical protein